MTKVTRHHLAAVEGTVQIALSTFLTAQTINLHEPFIVATFSIPPIPVLFRFVFLQRLVVQGVESTGINS